MAFELNVFALLFCFRVMSAIIATALVVMEPKGIDADTAISNLDLPDVVKAALKSNLKSYLEAVKIDGYETQKKRKDELHWDEIDDVLQTDADS